MNSSTQPDVAAAYDRWAKTYDGDFNRTRDMASLVLRKAGLVIAGRHILEIGCGTGRNTEWMIENKGSVFALDFSEEMLRIAEARVQSSAVRFRQHDIRFPWPVEDDSHDVVIAMLVLEHIESLEPIFAEAARVLHMGGEIFFCELHPMRQMSGRQAEFRTAETAEPERVTAFLHDASEYLNTALQSGFELLHIGEYRDNDAQKTDLPRLLSVQARLGKRSQ